MEKIRGRSLQEWKEYCSSENVPVKTMKYIICLEERIAAISVTRCSTQLKDKEVMTFESWVVENKETETYNAFLEGGFSFSLGDLYRKYAESLNKPLIV
jgi:hypothetical protein